MSENEAPEPGMMFLSAAQKGVPHEKINGRSVSFGRFLNGGVEVADHEDILADSYGAPGLILQGEEIVGELKQGEKITTHDEIAPKRLWSPAMNEPCPQGCGGTLVYLNKRDVRCGSCGQMFKDTHA